MLNWELATVAKTNALLYIVKMVNQLMSNRQLAEHIVKREHINYLKDILES